MVGEHVRCEENSLAAQWGCCVAHPDLPRPTRPKDTSPGDSGPKPDVMPPPSRPQLPALPHSVGLKAACSALEAEIKHSRALAAQAGLERRLSARLAARTITVGVLLPPTPRPTDS